MLITGSRLATDLASRIYLALGLDGISNVRYGDAQLGQLIGFIRAASHTGRPRRPPTGPRHRTGRWDR